MYALLQSFGLYRIIDETTSFGHYVPDTVIDGVTNRPGIDPIDMFELLCYSFGLLISRHSAMYQP